MERRRKKYTVRPVGTRRGA